MQETQVLLHFLFQETLEDSCTYSMFSKALAHFWSGVLSQHRTPEPGDPSCFTVPVEQADTATLGRTLSTYFQDPEQV